MMTAEEALTLGRAKRQRGRTMVEMGDAFEWIAKDVDWWVVTMSRTLGIIGADGLVDVNGKIARAFRAGFRGVR